MRHFGIVLRAVPLLLLRVPGPVFWNEMRYLFLRNRATGWVLGGVALLCAGAFALGSMSWFSSVQVEADPPGRRFFFVITLIALGFLLVMGPAYSAGAFLREKDRRTFDLLCSSGLSSFDLVLGKFSSALFRVFVGVLAAGPAALAAFALGGVEGNEFLFHLVFFFSVGSVAVAVGVMQSMLFRSFALSLFVTYLVLVYIFLATTFISLIAFVLNMSPLGTPYPGFWVISTFLNLSATFLFLIGSLFLSWRFTQWDY